jgi:hypothetical protein
MSAVTLSPALRKAGGMTERLGPTPPHCTHNKTAPLVTCSGHAQPVCCAAGLADWPQGVSFETEGSMTQSTRTTGLLADLLPSTVAKDSRSRAPSESFAGQGHAPGPAIDVDTQIFSRFCQLTFKQSMRGHVREVLHSERQDSSEGSSISYMDTASELSTEPEPEAQAERSIRLIGLLREVLQGAGDNLPPCFPPTWCVMDQVFEPCKAAVQNIALAAAADSGQDWSFQLLMELEEQVRVFLDVAADAGAGLFEMQCVQSSMQLVYTSMGKLGQQLLMTSIDAAMRGGLASMHLSGAGEMAGLPDCFEIFRMLSEQVQHPHACASGLHRCALDCELAVLCCQLVCAASHNKTCV